MVGRLMPSGTPRIPEPWEWRREKHCPRCNTDKPWALFSPKTYWSDGTVRNVQSWCRTCKQGEESYRAVQKRWRNRGRARLTQVKREWRHRRAAAIRAERNCDERLPYGPFLAWLEERAAELGSWAALAECLACDERKLRRIRDEQQTVALSFVDQCAVALGFHIDDIYEQEEARRPCASSEAPAVTG